VKGLIKATIFKQFCGGETIEESLKTAARLGKSGVGTILDHSVEGQEDDEALDHTVTGDPAHHRGRATAHGHPVLRVQTQGISPVQLLTDVSDGKTLTRRRPPRMAPWCSAAWNASAAQPRSGCPVLIDAEESWMQPAIDATWPIP
jgi:proline dehydrogenase